MHADSVILVGRDIPAVCYPRNPSKQATTFGIGFSLIYRALDVHAIVRLTYVVFAVFCLGGLALVAWKRLSLRVRQSILNIIIFASRSLVFAYKTVKRATVLLYLAANTVLAIYIALRLVFVAGSNLVLLARIVTQVSYEFCAPLVYVTIHLLLCLFKIAKWTVCTLLPVTRQMLLAPSAITTRASQALTSTLVLSNVRSLLHASTSSALSATSAIPKAMCMRSLFRMDVMLVTLLKGGISIWFSLCTYATLVRCLSSISSALASALSFALSPALSSAISLDVATADKPMWSAADRSLVGTGRKATVEVARASQDASARVAIAEARRRNAEYTSVVCGAEACACLSVSAGLCYRSSAVNLAAKDGDYGEYAQEFDGFSRSSESDYDLPHPYPIVWRYRAFNDWMECIDGLPYYEVYDEETDEYYLEPLPDRLHDYPEYVFIDGQRHVYHDGALFEEVDEMEELVWHEDSQAYCTCVVFKMTFDTAYVEEIEE